jgi:hypothetical protein
MICVTVALWLSVVIVVPALALPSRPTSFSR